VSRSHAAPTPSNAAPTPSNAALPSPPPALLPSLVSLLSPVRCGRSSSLCLGTDAFLQGPRPAPTAAWHAARSSCATPPNAPSAHLPLPPALGSSLARHACGRLPPLPFSRPPPSPHRPSAAAWWSSARRRSSLQRCSTR
jgi:hypothetical protein